MTRTFRHRNECFYCGTAYDGFSRRYTTVIEWVDRGQAGGQAGRGMRAREKVHT